MEIRDYTENGIKFCLGDGNLNTLDLINGIEEADDEVIINSSGGYLSTGIALYYAIKDKGLDVVIDDIAGSSASIAAMGGNKVYAKDKGSRIMIHKPLYDYLEGDLNSDVLKNKAKELDISQKYIENIYQAKTGLDISVIREMINNETILNAEEALKLGFIDGIKNKTNYLFKNEDLMAIKNLIELKDLSLSGIKNMFSGNVKNEDVVTEDEIKAGTEVLTFEDGTVVYLNEDIGLGTLVFKDAELTEPADSGTYNLGMTMYEITDGVITAIENVTDILNLAIKSNTSLSEQTASLLKENEELRIKIAKITKSKSPEIKNKFVDNVGISTSDKNGETKSYKELKEERLKQINKK